ncbi:MAG TPA: ATP-binding protein [Ferruginibacter sp.]|nr:ATP-binding protein [Ferruginibacter sp.]
MKISPIRILIVDDDEDDFLIIKEYITSIDGHQFHIDWCYTYNEAERKICEGKYHLYFVDYRLGAKTGLQLIQDSIAKNCEEPFILLTGNGNHAIDLMAMESGAVDYLVKGELGPEKLERCIRYSMERSSALKALRDKERKFRNIFERSKDTVFIADEKLVLTEVNNASFTLLQYEREELLSKSLYNVLANKIDAVVIREQLGVHGEVSDKEVEFLTKNGEKKYCILTLSTEADITGAKYVQGIIHDITSLKKAEKDTLMLEKLNVAGRLVRIMAHEVRNPLNNIMLSTDQLEQTIDNPESKICMEIINRNAKRIGDLITELLNSSRRDPVMVEKKTLQSIMDEALDAAIDRIKLRHIKLERDFVEEPAWVMADSEKLKISFLNIIINAIEAMPETDGKLIISIKKNNDKFIVSIEDNGCGISNENLSRLFEPYFTSKQNGMGLGLASTLNILQSHNATYDVQSELNKGTVFKLFFNMA